MRRYIFTAISILLLIVTFFMFGYDPTKWYGKFYNFLSIFTPFVLGGLGILSAIFGIKGDIRKVLIVLNAFF